MTIPDSSGAYLGTLEFVVTVGFGTPARKYAVVFDTGSDVSWIQCQPCSGHCYKQHDPIFDPTKSATYAAIVWFALKLHGQFVYFLVMLYASLLSTNSFVVFISSVVPNFILG